MTRKLKNRWLAVSVIWGVVLAITGWNIHLVNHVQSRRQDMETMQMDLRFIEAHQPAIREVRLHKSRLSHPVKSVGLGFLVVENNLKRLSWDFGLQQLRVETDNNPQVSNRKPISISATGTVPAVAGWITAVEEAYPYLVIERMEMAYDAATRSCQLQATFTYQFTLSEPERVG